MFKKLANLTSMLKQAQQLGGQMQNLGEKLKERRATGNAGGGMVEVEVNGLLEVLQCRIDEKLVAQGDRELIEDLVAAAVNQAVSKGKQLHAEAMQDLTGGLELPGLQDMMAKITNVVETEQDDPEQDNAESNSAESNSAEPNNPEPNNPEPNNAVEPDESTPQSQSS